MADPSLVPPKPSPSAPPPGAPAPRTVLVVDDEKNIRRTLQLVLEGEGYRVLGAETASQALSILASPAAPVDLAILDVKLPDITVRQDASSSTTQVPVTVPDKPSKEGELNKMPIGCEPPALSPCAARAAR